MFSSRTPRVFFVAERSSPNVSFSLFLSSAGPCVVAPVGNPDAAVCKQNEEICASPLKKEPGFPEVFFRVLRANTSVTAVKLDGSTRKLSERLYVDIVKSVFHGEHGLRALKQLARSYLTISKDLTPDHESADGLVSQLGHSVCRQGSVCTTALCGMAREDQRSSARRRAEHYYRQLEALRPLHQEAR